MSFIDVSYKQCASKDNYSREGSAMVAVSLLDKYPEKSGVYEVRYSGDERWRRWYFRKEKLSYSDSQWVVQHGETEVYKGQSWQGRLPDEWREL